MIKKLYDQILNEFLKIYQSMPIVHSSSIKHIKKIIEEGVCSYRLRQKEDFTDSGIFPVDIRYGLDKYVFANLGETPYYWNKDERVALLFDDGIINNNESFFTFHDIANLVHFCSTDIYEMKGVMRILSQLPKSEHPLETIHEILAINSLLNYSRTNRKKYFHMHMIVILLIKMVDIQK